MAPLSDASANSRHAFVADHVEPGATVLTDGWSGYEGLVQLGYFHDRRSQGAARLRRDDPHSYAHAGRPPCGVPGPTLAPGHTPRSRGRRPPAELPERVRLPLQPSERPQPWNALLPRSRDSDSARSCSLSGTRRCVPASRCTAGATAQTRASAKPPTTDGEPAMADGDLVVSVLEASRGIPLATLGDCSPDFRFPEKKWGPVSLSCPSGEKGRRNKGRSINFYRFPERRARWDARFLHT